MIKLMWLYDHIKWRRYVDDARCDPGGSLNSAHTWVIRQKTKFLLMCLWLLTKTLFILLHLTKPVSCDNNISQSVPRSRCSYIKVIIEHTHTLWGSINPNWLGWYADVVAWTGVVVWHVINQSDPNDQALTLAVMTCDLSYKTLNLKETNEAWSHVEMDGRKSKDNRAEDTPAILE